MKKKFNSALTVLLAVLIVISSALCGVAVNGNEADDTTSTTAVIDVTDTTVEETTEPSIEETTTEAPSEEETTEPSIEETTTETPSEEETTKPSTEDTTEHIHNYEQVITPAKDSFEGKIENVCSCGEKVLIENIPYVNHVSNSFGFIRYDGTVKKPEITVKASDTLLTEGVDYDIVWPEGMIEIGYYEATVVLKGKYSGEHTSGFYIIHSEKETPELFSATSTKNGVVIKWNDIFSTFRESNSSGRFLYMIYRKTKNTGWERIAHSVKGSEYLDKTAVYGETYFYTVKPYYTEEGEKYYGGYDKSGVSVKVAYATTPDAPKFEFKNTYGKISWSSVSGSTKYVLYRSLSADSGYKKIYTGTKRYYKDKAIEPGNTYYYKVKVYVGTKLSAASEFCSYTYKVAAPVFKERINVSASAIKLSWNKVKGADGYAIYRKTKSNGSWERIKTIKTGDTLSYTNKNVSGTYYYRMIAYHTENGKNIYGSYSDSAILKTLDKVATIKASTSKSKLTTTVKWSKVSGASRYEVYAKVSGTDWELIAETDSSTRVYTHSVGLNTNYYYKVRAIYKYSTSGEIATGAFSDYVKVKVDYLPEFSFELPDTSISKPTYITLKIKNTGNKTMRIYADGSTHLRPDENIYLNIETALKMKKSTSGKYVDFVDVPAGKTVKIYLYPTQPLVIGYNPKDFIGFMFSYNGGTYVAALSVYYGSQIVFMG